MNVKKIIIGCLLIVLGFTANAATTLRTVMYDPATSNTVPTNLNIKVISLESSNSTSPGQISFKATNALGTFTLTVDKDWAANVTNKLSLSNLVAGSVFRIKSVTAGIADWENIPAMSLFTNITYIGTNVTSYHLDWSSAQPITMLPTSLETNLVVIPTNMVTGRAITLICRAAHGNYNLSISNAAGTPIVYPFASTNSGSAALTVTNNQQIELSLLALSNKISVAFGRFK